MSDRHEIAELVTEAQSVSESPAVRGFTAKLWKFARRKGITAEDAAEGIAGTICDELANRSGRVAAATIRRCGRGMAVGALESYLKDLE